MFLLFFSLLFINLFRYCILTIIHKQPFGLYYSYSSAYCIKPIFEVLRPKIFIFLLSYQLEIELDD